MSRKFDSELYERYVEASLKYAMIPPVINPDVPLRYYPEGLLLDERQGISYPDGFQAPDGRIFVQYDRKRECGEILLAIFTEEDVLAGKNISGKMVLKHPAIQSYSARLENLNAQ